MSWQVTIYSVTDSNDCIWIYTNSINLRTVFRTSKKCKTCNRDLKVVWVNCPRLLSIHSLQIVAVSKRTKWAWVRDLRIETRQSWSRMTPTRPYSTTFSCIESGLHNPTPKPPSHRRMAIQLCRLVKGGGASCLLGSNGQVTLPSRFCGCPISMLCVFKPNNTRDCNEHLFGQVSTRTGRYLLPIFRCINVHLWRYSHP